MNNKKVDPFGFPVAEEYKLYKKNCKKSFKSMIPKIRILIQILLYKKPFKSLTYLEWERHIMSYFEKFNDRNLENFKHYLKNEKHRDERKLDNMNNILMPGYSLLSTIFMTYIYTLIMLGATLKGSFFGNCKDKNAEFEKIFQQLGLMTVGFTVGGITVIGILFLVYYGAKRENLSIRINFFEDLLSIIDKKKDS